MQDDLPRQTRLHEILASRKQNSPIFQDVPFSLPSDDSPQHFCHVDRIRYASDTAPTLPLDPIPPLAIQVFLEALRGAASGDLERTRRLLELAARLFGERNGARIVHALLTYLFNVTPLPPDTVRSLLSHPRSELENAMHTAAQQLYERGHREGKIEGKIIGKAEGKAEGKIEGEVSLLRQQLEHKFGPLPKRIEQLVAKADEVTLRTWSLRLLSAATLDEVFPKTPRRRPSA